MMGDISSARDGKVNNDDATPSASATNGDSDSDAEAMKYLEQLLNEGRNEGISDVELQFPPWYDEKLFKEGQSYLNKYRFYMSTGFLIGFIASLSIPSILKVLLCTQRSDTHKKAYRRYVGTILHTMTWYNKPLEPGSELWESLLIVRNAHFQSSRACSKLQAGRIIQKDLVLTQFSLIGFFMLGADRMGLNDQRFLEATTYMWRVLGYMLGIKDQYNVCGSSWSVTKPRFRMLMKRVFQPSLTNADSEYYETANILLEGLRPVHMVLTLDATMFYIKRLAGCKGYEYLESDYTDWAHKTNAKSIYYALGTWDRIVVSTAILTFTYLYKYAIVRWYLNFFGKLNEGLMCYFPYLAIYRYGWDWAFVRIFSKLKNKSI